MPNLTLKPNSNISLFRRIAIGSWRTAKDPTVYGSMTVRMDKALAYMKAFREKTGKRLTVTHMMAKVMGDVYKEVPQANSILRWNRIYQREDIAVFFQVVMEDPETGEFDLSGTVIREPEAKSLKTIVDEFAENVEKVRARKDENLERTRGMFRWIPYFLLNPFLDTVSFLSYTLNLDLRWAGLPKDPFGSVLVTNIGSLGLESAYVPLVPYSRVPLLVAMGAIQEETVVVDGEISIVPLMRLYASFDHRILDGAHAAAMVRVIQERFGDPFAYFDDLEEG